MMKAASSEFFPLLLLVSLPLAGCVSFARHTVDGVALRQTARYPDGTLQSSCSLLQHGKGKPVRHGQQVQWFPNGQKRVEREYRYGRLHGTETEWYEQGAVFQNRVWHDGVCVECFRFDQSGRLVSQYERGRSGLDCHMEFDDDGSVLSVNAGLCGDGGMRVHLSYGVGVGEQTVTAWQGQESICVGMYDAGKLASIDLGPRTMVFYRNGRRKAEFFPEGKAKRRQARRGVWYRQDGEVLADGLYVGADEWEGTFIDMDWLPPFTFRRVLEYREGELVRISEMLAVDSSH